MKYGDSYWRTKKELLTGLGERAYHLVTCLRCVLVCGEWVMGWLMEYNRWDGGAE